MINEHLERYGIRISAENAPEIRRILFDQAELERKSQGEGDTELMKLCCVQLFSIALEEDVLLIWDAKTASFDADSSIDVQLLCGMGLEETLNFLRNQTEAKCAQAFDRITMCVKSGDFDQFSPKSWIRQYEEYYDNSE